MNLIGQRHTWNSRCGHYTKKQCPYRLRQEPVDEEEAKEDKPEEAKEDKDSDDDDDATVEDKHKTKKVWLVINS